MTIPKEAIEKAIDGGWYNYPSDFNLNDHYVEKHDSSCMTALDPTFWQSLGKALGWPEEYAIRHKELPKNSVENFRLEIDKNWQSHAIDFYDLILTNGDTEKFWSDLLQK